MPCAKLAAAIIVTRRPCKWAIAGSDQNTPAGYFSGVCLMGPNSTPTNIMGSNNIRHKPLFSFWFMAGTTGLEPATSAVTGQRSNQLSYVPNSWDCHSRF